MNSRAADARPPLSDGFHQAVEAKEGVKIERGKPDAREPLPFRLFPMYKKLSGMTGTAETEAAEFGKIYNLDVNRHSHEKPPFDPHRISGRGFRTEKESLTP